MQQKDERKKAGHGCFPFRKRKSKEIKQYGETRRFEEDGWNLKDHKDSKKETSKRLTKHHGPKSKAQHINWAMQSEESEVNQ